MALFVHGCIQTAEADFQVSLDEAIGVIGRRIGWPDLEYVQFPYDEAAKAMMAMGISPDASR